MSRYLMVPFALLTVLTVQGQQLLEPAKYYVYKIDLFRRMPGGGDEQQIASWDKQMIMTTSKTGVRIYKSVGNVRQRTTVGAPVYQLSKAIFGKHTYDDGVSTEMYVAAYQGEITPPEDLVRDPTTVVVGWESAGADENVLKILWFFDEKPGKKASLLTRGNYRLALYCLPVQ